MRAGSAMKIAIVLQGGVDRSGERRVIPVVLALLERLTVSHEVHVFALRQEPDPGTWKLCGATIHNVGSSRAVHRVVAAIRREHRTLRFDVIHALWAGAGAFAAALAGRIMRVPLLVHLTGGELVRLEEIGYGQMLRLRWRLINRWVLHTAARVTATSDPIILLAAALGCTALRVPLGVDLNVWPPRSPAPRHAAVPRLIQVASLNRVKGLETTLAALRILHERGVEFEMDFVGEDTLNGEVQRAADGLGLGRQLRFHGFLTQRELRPLVEAAHIHVVSSRHEAGPAAALEAAIAGVPTVGTNVGHLTEWQPDAARVVACGDAVGLAAQIEALVADDTLRLRVASAAQRRALAEDASHTARQFEELYRQVTGG
jgi:glycosyltransferase involved in cell wall biosynthesis